MEVLCRKSGEERPAFLGLKMRAGFCGRGIFWPFFLGGIFFEPGLRGAAFKRWANFFGGNFFWGGGGRPGPFRTGFLFEAIFWMAHFFMRMVGHLEKGILVKEGRECVFWKGWGFLEGENEDYAGANRSRGQRFMGRFFLKHHFLKR